MSWANERQSIESRLSANWSTTPIAWENVDFEPPDNSSWIRATILNGETIYDRFSSKKRHLGIISIQIFSPLNQGASTARSYADTIKSIFDGQEFGGVSCQASSIVNVGNLNGWYQLNLNVPFSRYE